MAASWRVLLRPLLSSSEAGDAKRCFDGATLELTGLGPPSSALPPDAPIPAKLLLFARFLGSVRGRGEEEVRALGHLLGEVTLQKGTRVISFVGELDERRRPRGWIPESDPEALETETLEGSEVDELNALDGELREPSVRVLRFDFDAAQFRNVPTAGENELELQLDARRFRYLEVEVELQIAGQVQAARAVNEVLDVLITRGNPPRKPEPLTIRLTNEQGGPAVGAAFRILSGGELESGGTEGAADGEGQVTIRPRARAETCRIVWSTIQGEHTRLLFVDLGEGELAIERRLHNLGYSADPSLQRAVSTFQCEFRLEESELLRDVAARVVAWHDRGELPELGPELVVDTEPFRIDGPVDAEDRSDSSPEDEREPASTGGLS